MIISGFPGIGKSHFYQINKNMIEDSDSSHWSKANPIWVADYVSHLRNLNAQSAFVLCSTHEVIRKQLATYNEPFILVYPDWRCKDEYMERFRMRGSTQAFLELMDTNWAAFHSSCHNQTGCVHVVLQQHQYLTDVIKL